MSRDLRVCFAGDSYVAGAGDPSGRGWVGRVIADANGSGLAITGYNLGVRGETGPQIARRIPVEISPRLGGFGDSRLIVSFGANDTVERDGRVRASAAETVTALTDIHGSIDAPLLFVGPPAVGDRCQNERLAAINELLATEADRLNITFIDTFRGTAASFLWRQQVRDGDGYHPGAEGYRLLASMISGQVDSRRYQLNWQSILRWPLARKQGLVEQLG